MYILDDEENTSSLSSFVACPSIVCICTCITILNVPNITNELQRNLVAVEFFNSAG